MTTNDEKHGRGGLRQSVDFGGTSNRKNLKISVFGCFRVNLLEFGIRKYDLRKFGKLCNLLFLFFINL